MRSVSSVRWLVGLVLVGVGIFYHVYVSAAVDDRTRTALEALSRLKDADLEANPTLKQAVLRVLNQVRGEPEFVDVVTNFRLPGHEAELLQVATQWPQTPQATEAVRSVLGSTNAVGLNAALRTEAAPKLVELLGTSADPRALPFLRPLLVDTNRPLALRRDALKAMTKTSEGAHAVLDLAQEGLLPAELRTAAGEGLRAARWPDVRQAALRMFPAEPTTEAGALPPLAELMKMPGDPQRGAGIFRRPEVACITCHQVKNEGVDFGPKLSEIGSKLGKDALITAILEPSAGISFGFEAWRIELKNGDELFGLIVSDSENELAVKAQGGQVTTVKKSDVSTREKQLLSIMPAGLQQSLTTQDFVDLIAYLSSLKTVP